MEAQDLNLLRRQDLIDRIEPAAFFAVINDISTENRAFT